MTRNEVNGLPVTEECGPVLLDRFTPSLEFALVEQLLVDAPAEVAYAAIGRLDPSDVRTPGTRPHTSMPAFEEILFSANWALLGEVPGREIALGAAGRFWTPFMDWQPVTAEEFATFSRPRRGTIAVAFSVRPYGAARSLVMFDVRCAVTDPIARRWAEWYWHSIKPSARRVARQLLLAVGNAVR